MHRNFIQGVAAPLLLVLASGHAYAQTAAPTESAAGTEATEDAPAAASSAKLQEVTVTATRRSANLQKVAATVNVISADAVSQLGISNVTDMQGLVPGVTIVRTSGTVPFIRGVGTNNSGFTTETAVGMYIDGLYLSNSASGMFGFNNIERIEVLKGPQGTLYGRNTTGGLINVVTRDPEAKPHADLSLGYESYNKKVVNVYASTPLSDTLAMNVAMIGSRQGKGWGRNITTGNDVMKSDESGVQLKFVWKPQAGTKVSLRAFTDYMTTDQGVAVAVVPGTVGVDGTPYLGEYRVAMRQDPTVAVHQSNGALKLEQDVGFANLLSITGYQHNTSPTVSTQNGIPGKPVAGQSAVETFVNAENKTFSQELQLSSKPSDSPLDWITGFFYYDDVTKLSNGVWGTCVGSVCAASPVPTFLTAEPTTRSVSVYLDGSYTIREGTRLSLGLRHTRDKKELTGSVAPLAGRPNTPASLAASVLLHPGDPNGIDPSTTFSKTTFRAAVSQELSPQVQAYASFNRGFKAGGYNPSAFNNPVSRPEVLDAVEAGLKSELFERRLRLNLSAFNYEYRDIQLRSIAPPAPPGGAFLSNAAGARVRGLDVDFKVAATANLQITGGFEILDGYYTNFIGGSCSSLRPITGTVLGGTVSVPCDLSGRALINAPKYSYTLGLTYTVDVPIGSLQLAANDSFKSGYTFTSDGFPTQHAYHNTSGSVTWRSPDERYDVQFFGKNLGGTYYYITAQGPSSGNYVYAPGAPRTFGVLLGYHY